MAQQGWPEPRSLARSSFTLLQVCESEGRKQAGCVRTSFHWAAVITYFVILSGGGEEAALGGRRGVGGVGGSVSKVSMDYAGPAGVVRISSH
jgi:hypothetical protein